MQIQSSTLVESLIAMVVIVVCFGIGVMIYVNVLNSDKHNMKMKAVLIMNNEAIDTKKNKNFIDYEKQVGDFRIMRIISPYQQCEDLFYLKFIAISINTEKTIATHDELVVIR